MGVLNIEVLSKLLGVEHFKNLINKARGCLRIFSKNESERAKGAETEGSKEQHKVTYTVSACSDCKSKSDFCAVLPWRGKVTYSTDLWDCEKNAY